MVISLFFYCVSSWDLPPSFFIVFYLLQPICFLDPQSFISLLSVLHVIPFCLDFPFSSILSLSPSLPPTQPPPLPSTLQLPCSPLEVALPLLYLLPPPLLPSPLPSPTKWRPGRRRLEFCLPCWRTRPGGFMPRRPSCSSAWPWVSGACDTDSAHTSRTQPLGLEILFLSPPVSQCHYFSLILPPLNTLHGIISQHKLTERVCVRALLDLFKNEPALCFKVNCLSPFLGVS